MADKYIKKLNGYVIKDARVDNLLSDNSEDRVKRTETVYINQEDDDRGTMINFVGTQGTPSIGDKKLYAIGGDLTYDTVYGTLQAPVFSENGTLLSNKYATKDYVNTNGGKIDNIKVGNTILGITDKTVTIAIDGDAYNAHTNKLVTQSVVTKLKEDITGYAKGYTFDELKLDQGEQADGKKILLSTLADDSTGKKYKVGDSLYVLEQNVPDYWVAEVKDTDGGINGLYNSDDVLIGYTAGHYVIYELETAKVNLSSYAKYADVAKIEQVNSLPTSGTEHTLYVIKASSGKKVETVSDFITGEGKLNKSFTVTSTIGTGIDEHDISTLVTPVSATQVTTSYNALSGVLTISGYVQNSVSSVTVTINWQTGGRIGAIYEKGKWYYIPITTEDGAVAKAQADANGNVIHTTYATQTSVNNAVANTTLKATYADEELTLYVKTEGEASATT